MLARLIVGLFLGGCMPHARLVVLDGADVALPESVQRVAFREPLGLHPLAAETVAGFVAQTRYSNVLQTTDQETDADAIVVLTHLAPVPGNLLPSSVADQKMWVEVSWRLLDARGESLDALDDTFVLAQQPEGSVQQVFEDLAFSAGAAYARRLSSGIETMRRPFFASGDPRLQSARLPVRAGDWETASRLWREVARDGSVEAKVRARALHDLALYWEVRGNVWKALRRIEEAIATYDNPRSTRYRAILREQSNRGRRLRRWVAEEAE